LECKNAEGGKCGDMTLPAECPPDGIIKQIVFRYFIENSGFTPVTITKAYGILNGAEAMDFLSDVEKNPIPFQTTTNIMTSGRVSVNVCFPITISNIFEVEGATHDGFTCKTNAFSSFSINISHA
jgi:hypothetical protein